MKTVDKIKFILKKIFKIDSDDSLELLNENNLIEKQDLLEEFKINEN